MGGTTQAVPCPWDPCPNGHTFLHAVEVLRQFGGVFLSTTCSLLAHKGWSKDQRNWPDLSEHHSGSHLTSLGEGNCRCLEAEQGWGTKKKAAVTSSHKPPQAPPPCRDAPAARATGCSQSSSHCCCMGLSWHKKKSCPPLAERNPGHLLGLCFLLQCGATCRAACHVRHNLLFFAKQKCLWSTAWIKIQLWRFSNWCYI